MKCENCSGEHDGSYGSGRFCSRYCANSRNDNKEETKIISCCECGEKIEVNKRAPYNKTKCKQCKKGKCKGCGAGKIDGCKRPDICKKSQFFPTLEKYFGFDSSKIGTEHLYEEFDRVKNILIEDYGYDKLSIINLIEKYNHKNIRNFGKILKSLNINTRNFSQSAINAIEQDRTTTIVNPKYKHGGHLTGDNKYIFYRSSYELEYAEILDNEQIEYEVEKLRIVYGDSQLLKQRIAIPDFYLPETNEIIEIKSTGTYDEQNMKDKFESYEEHGYCCKLMLDKREHILSK